MEQIGKYAIVGQIGTGGFGIVYEGRDPFLKRRVAIKTCNSEEPDIRDRFFREAEIAGNLHDRNIVTVHDFGVQDGIPYLVQEYLTGEDLDRVVTRRDPLPPFRRVDILLQVARGLDYAHTHGVIHRDIKPANIRLTAEGVVKIMDFGIAKLSNVASHLTRTGMTLGTAAYLPPEQIRGTTVDHRADVFSFGVTAYELLTYKRPFAGKTISALFWELLQRVPEPISIHWPSCPHLLERVVMRCMAKDPAKRYATFGALIPELEAALAELQRSGRGEDPTAQHPQAQPAPRVSPPPTTVVERPAAPPAATPPPAPPAPPAAAVTPPAPPAAAPTPRARPMTPHQRLEAAATALRPPKPGDSGNLLGDVEEALVAARSGSIARRARELLQAGDLEGAERELAAVPAKAGSDVAAVRRDLGRARADRLLAQAAAKWQQGEPKAAIALLDQLLSAAPDHQDAKRLRQSWSAEVAEREESRARAASEAETRRGAVARAVAEAEALLAGGDLDGSEAVVAAAQADLGSHQPLRDLRRRISLARAAAGGEQPSAASPSPTRLPSVDASTVGVGPAAVTAARQRAEAAAIADRFRGASVPPAAPAAATVVDLAWPRPGAPAERGTGGGPPPSPPGPYAWQADPQPPSGLSAPRTRLLLLAVAGGIALLVAILLVRAALLRRAAPPVASPTPTVATTPSAPPSPAVTPPIGAIGGQATGAAAFPDRAASVLKRPTAAYPAGMSPVEASVPVDVLVSSIGQPLRAVPRPSPGTDPRLVAEAQRVALRSTYLPALRNGAPHEQQITVRVDFRPR